MKAFAKQLIAMESEEAALREDLLNREELGQGYHPELRLLHEQQADLVAEIVEREGWPTIKAIGEDAYDGLFMVALNAISRPAWMKRAYEGFKRAKDNMSLGYAAYLFDRIAYFERRPQVYATQWDVTVEGETRLWTLEDPEGLALRRAKAGLDTFEELDFALLELDLGQGLKRVMGQYAFLYEVGWLTEGDGKIRRLMNSLKPYASGGLLGPKYCQVNGISNAVTSGTGIDIIMPLQHKEAFEAFLRDEGHTSIIKGLTHGTYALKDDQGFLEISVTYNEWIDHEEGWWIKGLDMLLSDASQHTPKGWVLSQKALQRTL